MKKFIHTLALCLLSTSLLSACGGSSPTGSTSGAQATSTPATTAASVDAASVTSVSASTSAATPVANAAVRSATIAAAAATSAPSTTQWTFCASENSACIFTGTQTVRYGAGTQFISKSFDWAASCSSTTFGSDPAPGVVKHCEVTSTWQYCSAENAQCAFGDTETVRFGANTTFVTQTLTGGAACSTASFGDPLSGTAKHCDRAATTWTLCAAENGTCSFSGSQVVLYGANGAYTTKTLTDGSICNNSVFGDPIANAAKSCYIPGKPVADIAMTTPGNPSSPVGTWNKLTTFNLVNGTHGQYADAQVYWAIIGKDPATGKFVHVDASGKLVPMALSDNGALSKNGLAYTNYFQTLAQAKSVTIAPIDSARMFLSVGSPMYIQVNADINGNLGYAGANIENPADPNINVTFDFIEMAILPDVGFFGNTTRVDQFGFPVLLRVQGLGGYDQTVGETETRAALFAAYAASVPAQFKALAQTPYSPYRIVAPAHANFANGGANATYLDGYISALWSKYATQSLTFTDAQGTFTGKVVNNVFQFSDGAGTYNVGKPTTAMALLGSGTLADASGTVGGTPAYDKQLQIQAQLCAAINRHIVEDPAHWSTPGYFYPAGQAANWYAQFWHAHSVNALAYGFAYDDVGSFSASLHTTAPTVATVTIGW